MNPHFIQYTQTFFNEHSSWHEKREALIALQRLFVALGAEESVNRLDNQLHTWLPSGFAIHPVSAGVCMLEVGRTLAFTQALKAAITHRLQQQNGQTVQVLDAGCGPYVLLCLLVTPFFTPEEVQFTVLDIYQQNLDSAGTLVRALGVEAYFSEMLKEDASVWTIPPNKTIHIAISETMKSALYKEPQTAITLNIAPQLGHDGLFIPRKITVDLRMVNRPVRNEWLTSVHKQDAICYSDFETELGPILSLSAGTTREALEQAALATFTIPNNYDPGVHQLELFTTIELFGNISLTRKQSSITLPVPLEKHYETTIAAGSTLVFRHELSGTPGLRFVLG